MSLRSAMAAAAAAQLAGLLAVGWWFREALNTDAVAYLRLAEYYAQGQWPLAVSGYWGPLLSWLLAPWLALGCPPWLAARLVMGMSAILFLAGCTRWFLSLPWTDAWKKAGIWTAAAVSVPWSVANITPDLLLAGLLGFVWMALYQARLAACPRWSFLAGALAGVAFLAKAVALPVAGLAAGGWLLGNPFKIGAGVKNNWGVLAAFVLGLAMVSAPWTAVLTAHYGQFTISRSAGINHALAGPPGVERYHPAFRTFHAPPPGRLTTWEDPSEMAYPPWRPWAGISDAWHQAKVIGKNLALMQLMLTTVFLDWPVVLGWWWWRRRRATTAYPSPPHVRLAAWGLVAIMAVYAPNFLLLGDQRYFYPALPLLMVAGVWMAEGFAAQFPDASRWLRMALPWSFVVPSLALLLWWLPPKRAAGQTALALAEQLRAAHLRGATAGSALLPGGRAGLMTAYYLGLPWLGGPPGATPEACLRSGADLFFVHRTDPLAEALAQHPNFAEVSLAPGAGRRAPPPVAVFRRVAQGTEK